MKKAISLALWAALVGGLFIGEAYAQSNAGRPAAGRIQVGQTSALPLWVALSRDCALSVAGAITCTKTNNVSFAASATTDTTDASNISAGTLNCAREPALTGDITSSAGSCATTLIAGVAANKLNSVTADYPIANTDCGKTIQAGTGSSGYFTITLPSVSGFATTCTVRVKNMDTGRAKLLSGFPSDIANTRLWPLQIIEVSIINGAWATTQKPGRWLLPANQTIFVDSSGAGKDDTTIDGLASGSAFHTSSFAYSTVRQNFDLAGQFTVTESQVTNSTTLTAGNTYSGALYGCPFAMASASLGSCYIINGNGIATTTIASSTASVALFQVTAGASIQVQNMAIGSSGASGSVFLCVTGYIAWQTVNFTATGNAHVDGNGPQCALQAIGNYTVSGSVNIHAVAEDMAIIYLGKQVTISGTPVWTTAFAQADLKGFIEATGFTFTGAGATGKRVQVISQGTVFTAGGSLNTFFPGNVNGTADAASFAYFN